MGYAFFKPFASAPPDPAVTAGRVVWQPAIDCPETAGAVRRWWLQPVFSIAVAVAVHLLSRGDGPLATWNGAELFAAIALIFGVGYALVAAVNLRRLRNRAWEEWPGTFVQLYWLSDVSPIAVLTGADGERHVLAVYSNARTWRSLADAQGSVWLCGDPGRFGMISLPGGAKPLFTGPVVWSRKRAIEAADAAMG